MARPGRPERKRAAQSFRQFRRLHHVINSDEVFGTHSKKRHLLVDTLGLLLLAVLHSADIQDRPTVLIRGPLFANELAKILPCLKAEIIKRSGQAKGFNPLPKRWIVERTIAWLNRSRRLAKDWENLNRNALAFLRLASIRLMLRKPCNP
jgi:putative transposase